MKSFMYAAKAVFVTLLFCCSGLAYADGACPPGGIGTAECPQNIDTVEVTTGRGGGGGGGYEEGGCGSACNTEIGGGIGGGTDMGSKPKTGDDFKQLFNKARVWCQGGNETCTDWGQRIDAGLCRTFLFAVSVCIIAVQEEVTAGCKIVSKCP